MKVDVERNRQARKYSNRELLLRVLWSLVRPTLFALSPRPARNWRCWLLRLFGAEIGRHVHIYASAHIYYPWKLKIGDESSIGEWALVYNLGPVTIGSRTGVSQRVHLCAGTHDYLDSAMPLLKPPIVIGDEAWICADAFVGPNVTIGDRAIVGARAVVVKDCQAGKIYAGNPARVVKDREPFQQPDTQ